MARPRSSLHCLSCRSAALRRTRRAGSCAPGGDARDASSFWHALNSRYDTTTPRGHLSGSGYPLEQPSARQARPRRPSCRVVGLPGGCLFQPAAVPSGGDSRRRRCCLRAAAAAATAAKAPVARRGRAAGLRRPDGRRLPFKPRGTAQMAECAGLMRLAQRAPQARAGLDSRTRPTPAECSL